MSPELDVATKIRFASIVILAAIGLTWCVSLCAWKCCRRRKPTREAGEEVRSNEIRGNSAFMPM